MDNELHWLVNHINLLATRNRSHGLEVLIQWEDQLMIVVTWELTWDIQQELESFPLEDKVKAIGGNIDGILA